jgi:hypothetical protein
MTPQWQPYREPLRTTVLRTGAIAIIVGAVIARFRGGWSTWPIATLLVLWPSYGGHWVEVWFLNELRPRISSARGLQIVARVAVWFAGGLGLTAGARLTATLAGRHPWRWANWWMGGLAFICVELIAHVFLQLSGRPSFYNGRG